MGGCICSKSCCRKLSQYCVSCVRRLYLFNYYHLCFKICKCEIVFFFFCYVAARVASVSVFLYLWWSERSDIIIGYFHFLPFILIIFFCFCTYFHHFIFYVF